MLKLFRLLAPCLFLFLVANPVSQPKPDVRDIRKDGNPVKKNTMQVKDAVVVKDRGHVIVPLWQANNYALASWYGKESCVNPSNCRAADGSVFDEMAATLACSYNFPLGSRFIFSYQGKEVEGVCTDRGAFEKYGRDFDLSKGLFSKLAPLSKGVIRVSWQKLN